MLSPSGLVKTYGAPDDELYVPVIWSRESSGVSPFVTGRRPTVSYCHDHVPRAPFFTIATLQAFPRLINTLYSIKPEEEIM